MRWWALLRSNRKGIAGWAGNSVKKSLRYKSPSSPGIEALSCASGFAFPRHIHNGHVLWLNSEGGEEYNLKGCTTILQPGCVSIIEPGIVHSNRPWNPARRHLRSLYLSEDFFCILKNFSRVRSKANLPCRRLLLRTVNVGNRQFFYMKL